MVEEQIAEIGLLGWFVSKTKDGRNLIETPEGEFIIEDDFDAFWVYERSGENEYTSVDAFSKFEDAIDTVKKWLK
ncbi:hypothetical protein KNT92_gp058 [Klebsiella phage Mineola]|uniref:Uncharacterized protein n=1 Tax=Klebsiella phage Mineola TaxID=2234047 RepID=A0A2Z4QBH8_9CAUD|nr:hypothetical protein KNT92_gp058 [Klebsiella phage Mineola]AWY06953.1 hypothetical protein CPT_Mineola_058 [Klebsiella phage Mineola]